MLTFLLAPSRAPTNFTVTPSTSTRVQASWQLPTADFQTITGFRLLYRKFSSVEDPLTVITIESSSTLSYEVTGLAIFTKYEFQVLAFSIVGDGPSSAVKTVRTNAEGTYSLRSYFYVVASKLRIPALINSSCSFSEIEIIARPLSNPSVKAPRSIGNRWLLPRLRLQSCLLLYSIYLHICFVVLSISLLGIDDQGRNCLELLGTDCLLKCIYIEYILG